MIILFFILYSLSFAAGCIQMLESNTLYTISNLDDQNIPNYYGRNEKGTSYQKGSNFSESCNKRFLWLIERDDTSNNTFRIYNRKYPGTSLLKDVDGIFLFRFYDLDTKLYSNACILGHVDQPKNNCYLIMGNNGLSKMLIGCEKMNNMHSTESPLPNAFIFRFTKVKELQPRKPQPNVLKEVRTTNMNTIQKWLPIDSCKNGMFNKVFYENDIPKYCLIVENGTQNGLCMNITMLYHKLKTFQSISSRRQLSSDKAFEFKRYCQQVQSQIYGQLLDDNYVKFHDKGFDLLFIDGLLFLQSVHPEIHTVSFDGYKFGATAFCDMALRLFPVGNNILMGKVPPETCPRPSKALCTIQSENRFPVTFPTNLSLIYYKDQESSTGCYVPKNHVEFPANFTGGCISVEDGIQMINTKDKTLSGLSTYYRNDYMAGVLRLSQHPHDKEDFVPYSYWWDTMRNNNQHVADILLQIDIALGYAEDEKLTININNTFDDLGAKTVKISYRAFCTAVIEMIPFTREILQAYTKPCSP